jgi:hypothetical protein
MSNKIPIYSLRMSYEDRSSVETLDESLRAMKRALWKEVIKSPLSDQVQKMLADIKGNLDQRVSIVGTYQHHVTQRDKDEAERTEARRLRSWDCLRQRASGATWKSLSRQYGGIGVTSLQSGAYNILRHYFFDMARADVRIPSLEWDKPEGLRVLLVIIDNLEFILANPPERPNKGSLLESPHTI